MVDLDAPLSHHLLKLAVADRIGHIPPHTPQDDIPLEVAALEVDRHRLVPNPRHLIIQPAAEP
jgi:hypothetical protein